MIRPLSSLCARYSLAVASSLLALLLTLYLRPAIAPISGPFYLGPVLLSAWYGGLGPSLLAILLSALALDYFYLPPMDALGITGVPDALAEGTFVVVGVLVGWLTVRSRALLWQARWARDTAEALADLARQAAAERDAERLIALITEQGCRLLGADYAGVAMPEPNGTFTLHGLRGSRSPELPQRTTPAPPSGIGGRAFAELRTVVVERLGENAEYPLDQHPLHRDEGARVVLAAPLLMAAEALGVLVLGWRSDARLPPAHVRLAEALASHAAVALDNARAHARIAASEERFRVALQNSPVVVFNQDRDLRYTWVYNPHRGYTLESILGRTDAELFAADDAAHLTALKRRVLESGVGARGEVAVTLGGEQLGYDLAVEPLHDPSGQVVGITCATTDVTALKQAQEALRQAEARLRTIVENAPIILFALDRDGHITFSEGKGLDVLGFQPGELVGHTIADVYPNRPDLLEIARRALAGEQFSAVTEVGEMVLEAWFTPLCDPSGECTGTIAVVADVTERRRADEALQQARRAEWRLEGVSLAARELAHLLNDDLALPVLPLDVLQEQATLPPDHRHMLELAISGLASAAHHIRQFQRVVRVEIKDTPMGPSLDLARSVQGQDQAQSERQ